MSTSVIRNRRTAVLAFALLAASAGVLATVAHTSTGRTDRQLARALVVAKGDALPSSWTIRGFHNDARGKCMVRFQSTITARVRDGFGDENSGMWSVATVLKTRAEANRYYDRVAAALPACLRVAARHAPIDADSVGVARPLSFRRYGDRSAAWRLRATYSGNRFHYDWVVVRTGRAVLVDAFVLGAPGNVAMEQEIVRRALRRASAGA